MAPGVPSAQRTKIPLLTALSAQKSVLNSKLVYVLGVTRKPDPFVAVIVPSSTFQSALPVGDKPDNVRPSNSRVQPALDSVGLSVLFEACRASTRSVPKSSMSSARVVQYS